MIVKYHQLEETWGPNEVIEITKDLSRKEREFCLGRLGSSTVTSGNFLIHQSKSFYQYVLMALCPEKFEVFPTGQVRRL